MLEWTDSWWKKRLFLHIHHLGDDGWVNMLGSCIFLLFFFPFVLFFGTFHHCGKVTAAMANAGTRSSG